MAAFKCKKIGIKFCTKALGVSSQYIMCEEGYTNVESQNQTGHRPLKVYYEYLQIYNHTFLVIYHIHN